MSRTGIVTKILSAEALVPLQEIHGGRMGENDWRRVTGHSVTLSGGPLFIGDSPNLAMMEIHAKARRLRQCSNLQLIYIDYIQLMTSGKKAESRQLEVSEFSCQIRPLVKELEVPVIALSQLSHNVEQRKDGVSQLTDLHESGSLEQGADIVIMLHHPELCTQSPTDEEHGQAVSHILKRHDDQLDKIDALLQGHCSRLTNQPITTLNLT